MSEARIMEALPLTRRAFYAVLVLFLPLLSASSDANDASGYIENCDQYSELETSEFLSSWHCRSVHGDGELIRVATDPVKTSGGACFYQALAIPVYQLKEKERYSEIQKDVDMYLALEEDGECPDASGFMGNYLSVPYFSPGSERELEYQEVITALSEWAISHGCDDKEGAFLVLFGDSCQELLYWGIYQDGGSYFATGSIGERTVVFTVNKVDQKWKVSDVSSSDTSNRWNDE